MLTNSSVHKSRKYKIRRPRRHTHQPPPQHSPSAVMVHRPHPRWSRGFHCPFHDADFLERGAVCRARSQSALACHKATRSSQQWGCISLAFEDVAPPLSNEDEDNRNMDVGDNSVSPPPQPRLTTMFPSSSAGGGSAGGWRRPGRVQQGGPNGARPAWGRGRWRQRLQHGGAAGPRAVL